MGKDCVAIEVRYHKTCHLNYCRCLTRAASQEQESGELYKQSYNVFCAKVIMEKIIQQKKVSRMTKLHEKFIKTVQETEGIDATNYRKYLLKARLQRDHPQLTFHQEITHSLFLIMMILRKIQGIKLMCLVELLFRENQRLLKVWCSPNDKERPKIAADPTFYYFALSSW